MSDLPPDSRLPATSTAEEWSLDRVVSLKGRSRLAVVIPARNEESTVGRVVADIAAELGALVDELVVMDSLSDDRTAVVAERAGARVHSVSDVRPDLGVFAGKGEALWKSMFVTEADIVAFIDADLTMWGTHFVTGVLGPILDDPRVHLCRGFYDRVLDTGSAITAEGGRVTELVAKPWLALFRPELAGMVQPLAGEWAIRREEFEQLSIPMGYGVELSTLLDVHQRHGLDAIAQVDLGRRGHQHQNIHDLSAMAVEILAAAERRQGSAFARSPGERDGVDEIHVALPRMLPDRSWQTRSVSVQERPPWRTHLGLKKPPDQTLRAVPGVAVEVLDGDVDEREVTHGHPGR